MGHPLIHLGYAFEISSREVAMEALGLAATCYGDLHKYLDDPRYSNRPRRLETTSSLEILARLKCDTTFNNLFDAPGGDNMTVVFRDYEEQLLTYWNAWRLVNPTKQFEDSQQAATAMLIASGRTGYDFFIVHLLTTSHAVRILIPMVAPQFHLNLVKQWWLVTLAIYIAQLRPEIDVEGIKEYDTRGRDWDWVCKEAVSGKYSLDAHYVKAVRAMQEAANTWGDQDAFYLKAAVKFASEFDGWGGFGESEERFESQHVC